MIKTHYEFKDTINTLEQQLIDMPHTSLVLYTRKTNVKNTYMIVTNWVLFLKKKFPGIKDFITYEKKGRLYFKGENYKKINDILKNKQKVPDKTIKHIQSDPDDLTEPEEMHSRRRK